MTWANGRRDRIGEDYEPWTYVRELRDDHLVWPSDEGEVDFEARWLEGQERETAWHRFGITDDPGAYGRIAASRGMTWGGRIPSRPAA